MRANGPQARLDREIVEIQARIEGMETHPGSWGDGEALELQWLLLVEARQRLVRPVALGRNPHETRNAWIRFIVAVYGEPTSCPLSWLLREHGRSADLPRLLGDAARWIAQEYPPEWTP